MFKRVIVCILSVTMMASFVACGDKVDTGAISSDENISVASTEISDTTKAMSPSDQLASEQASFEDVSRKAAEAMSSMAAVVEKAAREEESKEAVKKAEAESKAAEAQSEIASQAEAVQAAINQANISGQTASSDDAVITVVDTYGVESARQQYAANYEVYMELIRLTNELRASLGVEPLAVNETLCLASCKKAIDYYLADYYDGENHTMIDGRKWTAILDEFNISCTSRAENLAKGASYKTAQSMFDGWKNSPIHYDNMINPKYTQIGVGSCGYVWFMDLTN